MTRWQDFLFSQTQKKRDKSDFLPGLSFTFLALLEHTSNPTIPA